MIGTLDMHATTWMWRHFAQNKAVVIKNITH